MGELKGGSEKNDILWHLSVSLLACFSVKVNMVYNILCIAYEARGMPNFVTDSSRE